MRQRSVEIGLRVTPEEFEKIKEKMQEAGIGNLTAYMIHMAMNGYIIKLDFKELKENLRLLSIMSNNLNQYAKKANETGSIYQEDIQELKKNQRDLTRQMAAVINRLLEVQ